MENTINVLVVLIACVVCYWLGTRDRRKNRHAGRKLLTVPMIKINFHPANVKWEWSRFNPKTRTWEWLGIDATPVECERFMDILFTEEDGLKLLSDRMSKENDNG